MGSYLYNGYGYTYMKGNTFMKGVNLKHTLQIIVFLYNTHHHTFLYVHYFICILLV